MIADDDAPNAEAPGAVPPALRAALARLAQGPHPVDAAALDRAAALLLEGAGDDAARAAAVETLLAVEGGREALGLIAAARRALPADRDAAVAPVGAAAPLAGAPLAGAPLAGAPLAGAPALRVERGAAPPVVTDATRPVARPRWLLAAALLAVVSVGGLVLQRRGAGDALRDGARALAPVAPAGDLGAPPARLVWRGVRGAPRYTVEVLDTTDAAVLIVTTGDTTAAVPAGSLRSGAYRWYVRARATDGSEQRSALARFTIR